MILLDTSALIEFLNRTGSRYDTTIETLISSDAVLAVADMTLTEVLQGIRSERDYREVRASLITFPVLSLTDHTSYIKAADMYRACRAKGLTIRSTVDLLIAQTAIENSAELLHNDRDFEALATVSSLKLYPC
ncbi:MAG TPA: PIN domain nuclease [Desulfuromonadales bacterium]|nr:PIN domain nuclease [Desulfuromonadales bacterium]